MIPNDDYIWVQEKSAVSEALFRIVDYAKYILRNIKLYYDNADKALRDEQLEALNLPAEELAALRAEGVRSESMPQVPAPRTAKQVELLRLKDERKQACLVLQR